MQSSAEHLPCHFAFRGPARCALSLVVEVVPIGDVCCEAFVVHELDLWRGQSLPSMLDVLSAIVVALFLLFCARLMCLALGLALGKWLSSTYKTWTLIQRLLSVKLGVFEVAPSRSQPR